MTKRPAPRVAMLTSASRLARVSSWPRFASTCLRSRRRGDQPIRRGPEWVKLGGKGRSATRLVVHNKQTLAGVVEGPFSADSVAKRFSASERAILIQDQVPIRN